MGLPAQSPEQLSQMEINRMHEVNPNEERKRKGREEIRVSESRNERITEWIRETFSESKNSESVVELASTL